MRCLHRPTVDADEQVRLQSEKVSQICICHGEDASIILRVIPLVILDYPRQVFWACELHVVCATSVKDISLVSAARDQARHAATRNITELALWDFSFTKIHILRNSRSPQDGGVVEPTAPEAASDENESARVFMSGTTKDPGTRRLPNEFQDMATRTFGTTHHFHKLRSYHNDEPLFTETSPATKYQ